MKKTSLFALLLVLFTTNLLAQKKGFVSLNLGGANPIGDFGSKESTNSKAGLANLGILLDLAFGYKFHENIGVTAMIRSQANPIDGQVFADALANALPSGTTAQYSVKSWATGMFLVGPFASFKVSDKFYIEPRVMGGLTSISNPEINITFSNNTWLKQISTDASGFGYLIGAGVKYNLSEKWCLIGNIDYTGASIDFKDVTTTYSNGFIQKSSNTLTFASVNSTIGIGLRF
jgi:hypothetical protein